MIYVVTIRALNEEGNKKWNRKININTARYLKTRRSLREDSIIIFKLALKTI